MATRWERFAGNEDRFAIRVALRPDPTPEFEDPDVSASWGSVQFWLNGKNICAHADQGETLDSLHWHLLPLLEWLGEHWDAVFHEERLPIRVRGAAAIRSLQETLVPSRALSASEAEHWEVEWFSWWNRHALRAARSGGPFPDVVIRRWRDKIEFSWADTPLAGDSGLRFLADSGIARMDPADVGPPLLEAVTAVTQELATRRATERILALQHSIASIEDVARQTVRVAWMAGLRSADDSVRQSWELVEQVFADATREVRDAALGITERAGVVQGSCQAALLFGAVAPDISAEDVQRMARLLIEQYEPAAENPELRALTRPSPVPTQVLPWEDGYERADEVREALELQAGAAVDLNAIFARLGVEERRLELDDPNVRGVAIASPDHTPTVAINERSFYAQWEGSRRFTLAHEFCHLLFDRAAGRRLAVATGPWAPLEVEQRANAFAAAFLMSPESIRAFAAHHHQPLDSEEGILQVAAHFGVTEVALIEHLRATGFISDADRVRLRAFIARRLQD